MKVLKQLNPEIVDELEVFRKWVFQEKTQQSIYEKFQWPESKCMKEGRPEHATSRDFLMSMDHGNHIGYPTDFYGVDLNYETIKKNTVKATPEFFEEIRQVSNEFDSNLQNILGARYASLKAYYPAQGYIGWHTNWNAPGYNIIFTYSKTGDGYWRHIDPEGSQVESPDPEKLVHINDTPGWHCKVGYYGSKSETDRLMWHSAYTNEPRITIGYILYDKDIWENVIEEIEEYN